MRPSSPAKKLAAKKGLRKSVASRDSQKSQTKVPKAEHFVTCAKPLPIMDLGPQASPSSVQSGNQKTNQPSRLDIALQGHG